MDELQGKTAVITGAASGMGLAMAKRFAKDEMNVVLSDINESALGTAVDQIRDAGGKALGAQADVSSEADNAQLMDAVIDELDLSMLCASTQAFRDQSAVRGCFLTKTTNGRSVFSSRESFMACARSCLTWLNKIRAMWCLLHQLPVTSLRHLVPLTTSENMA